MLLIKSMKQMNHLSFPDVLVDDAPIVARGSGDLADDPGGEEVEMVEVLDPVTGETTLIPKSRFILL